mgnify:CR=1 FL=1
MQRLLNSAKIYRMEHPWTLDQVERRRSRTGDGAAVWISVTSVQSCFGSLDEAESRVRRKPVS